MEVQGLWNCMGGEDLMKVKLQRTIWGLVPKEGEASAGEPKSNLGTPSGSDSLLGWLGWHGTRPLWPPIISMGGHGDSFEKGSECI